jgi:cobyrinic acid a,c-diamide synthase
VSAPGLIIAAAGSGSGKTTVTLGLLRALRDAGVRVASAKVGPDYIDPQFHAAASGQPCLNLDPWAMRPATRAALVAQLSATADIIICEGVMGLYDGIDASGTASTAELAAELGWPVMLVVDAQGVAASAAALVQGLVAPPASLARDGLQVAGVIFNRVGGARHLEMLCEAVQRSHPHLSVLGGLARTAGIALPERHLGLVPAGENAQLEEVIGRAARLVADSIDLAALRRCARSSHLRSDAPIGAPVPPLAQRIAIARDDAFVFAYPWLLDGWRSAGAELAFFSPLADEAAPEDAAAVYLPGGYPELHAGRLAAAERFISGLRRAAARGTVIYGECGGYMVLGEALVDGPGRRHAMAGLLPLVTSFAAPKLHLGYRAVTLRCDTPLGRAGSSYRAHEFHYASIVQEGAAESLFDVADSRGHRLATAGLRSGAVCGSFIHLIDHANL